MKTDWTLLFVGKRCDIVYNQILCANFIGLVEFFFVIPEKKVASFQQNPMVYFRVNSV